MPLLCRSNPETFSVAENYDAVKVRREPGIHSHRLWLWIPGSLATLGPRNDDGEVQGLREGMTITRLTAAALTTALAVTVLAAPASAQDWPTRPVRVLAPFTPGGTADILG